MFRKCYWLYYSDKFSAIPEGGTEITASDVGAQAMSALYEAIDSPDTVGVDLYQDPYGNVYAVVTMADSSVVIMQRKCSGSQVSPYVIGMAIGSILGGLAGSQIKRLQRYRPASTLIGVALGLVSGGIAAHTISRKTYGSNTGLIQATKQPTRGLGSLYLPQDGGLPRDMRVGLIEAQKRYEPQPKNW